MRTTSVLDAMIVTCNTCGYAGSVATVQLHSCDVQLNGGRCEDYPCCGHTDGDGCQTLAEHTADFYVRNPQYLYEAGSPEWYDAMDEMYRDYDDEED